nr:MAG TPA: hypothetical protein [Caudoviricetes sp.]
MTVRRKEGALYASDTYTQTYITACTDTAGRWRISTA